MSKHLISITLFASLAMPVSAQSPPAGSAGAGSSAISGVPAGPGSAGGINNSVSDPSGIGNAARVPALRSGSVVAPVPVPQGGGVISTRSRPVRVSRVSGRGLSEAQQEAAVKENDKLLGRKLRSICNGC